MYASSAVSLIFSNSLSRALAGELPARAANFVGNSCGLDTIA